MIALIPEGELVTVIDRDAFIDELRDITQKARSGEIGPTEIPTTIKRGRGRPRKIHNPKKFLLRAETEVMDQFANKCDREGKSINDRIRELILADVSGSIR